MSRRRSSSSEEISLFPFLSILACVIGTLTMMITALVLSQAAGPSAKDAKDAAEAEVRVATFQKLQQQLKVEQEELERLKKRLAEMEALRKKLMEALASAQKGQDKARALEAEIVKLIAEAELLQARIKELEKSLIAPLAELQQLMAELKKRQTPPKESAVKIRPSGSGQGLQPIFVECNARGVVIHQGAGSQPVATADLTANPAYLNLLQTVASLPQATLIFLIRTNGITSYRAASKLANDIGARNGKLPVPSQGVIDLGLFQGGK